MDNIAGQKSSFVWASNIATLTLVLLWIIPTLGLFVSSFRDRDQISASGWWKAPFAVELTARGRTGADTAPEGDHFSVSGNIFDDREARAAFTGDPGAVSAFGIKGAEPRAFQVGTTADLGGGETLTVNPDGSYVWVTPEDPGNRGKRIYFAAKSPPKLTLANYRTVLTSDNMSRAFMNTLTVAVPATIIPILVAAFAAYSLAWMEFKIRGLLIAGIVGLLVVPIQLALVPVLNLHNAVGIGQSFPGIWLAHTGFGMPLAVYLLRNYMAGLPRDIIECARVDGATDFQIFVKIILPLSLPALASFAIFQFLWTWNDLLVAKVFLPSADEYKVMTVKIADDLLGSRGGDWGILAAAAFVSIAVPLAVFFSLQRFLVRGLLAGSVK
ncbi:carbohydrate ABC transporter permease [Tropicimonas sp. IMCC34043]|uniref:carbohydrate ABC transporter permease n=1 Tax=Tropicimonas sp. IMCC34043 TaxID=2248760 RepID=UPI000E28652D|nr:carbohydrate ABC transporter permease [Tropicimonas sp. IMCC34043]